MNFPEGYVSAAQRHLGEAEASPFSEAQVQATLAVAAFLERILTELKRRNESADKREVLWARKGDHDG